MHDVIEIMLNEYQCKSVNDYINAVKEIIQKITLLGLWRAKFFENVAFYDGTALRIFYQLDRFSEDLDFSLLNADKKFKLEKYNEAIISELKAFGFEIEISSKIRDAASNIEAAHIKTQTKQQLIAISAPSYLSERIHSQQKINVKMEVDIDPPMGFKQEAKMLLNPIPFEVNVYQISDLFSTKIHALLCRSWGSRVKGRDWFDLVWYISRNIPVCLSHLESRLRKNQVWTNNHSLTENDVQNLLLEKINKTDFELAKKDVLPFIKDNSRLALWSQSFFHSLVEKILYSS